MTTTQAIELDAYKFKQKQVARDTYEVTFGLSTDHFTFQSGQYVTVRLKNPTYSDPKGNSRTFSIASSLQEKSKVSVVFRNSGSVFKQALLESQQGSQVILEGPFGHFTVANSVSTKIFIAAGTGIAPFMSTLRGLKKEPPVFLVHLLFANRTEKDTAYQTELKKISQKVKNFSTDYVYGRITDEKIDEVIERYGVDAEWYVAGPPLMVKEVTYLCQRAGVPYSRIKTEEFIGY